MNTFTHSFRETDPFLVKLRLRQDLVTQPLQASDGQRWVVKDPLSNEFHFFSDIEMRIMRLLDGRPIAAVMQAGNAFLRNEYLSSERLVAFLADLQQRGLLVSVKKPSRDAHSSEFFSPLAIRFPGFNPERLLDALYRSLAWMFQPITLVLVSILVLLAILSLLRQADRFFREVPTSTAWFTMDTAWMLVIVIGVLKIIHELAHGLMCRHFGGRCTEIGMMLLCFIPCVYCDVSDMWLQPKRWARIAVSAAGIGVELIVASCAALIWAMTDDGTLHSVCFTVMLVGSIQTLLFNGNPLMRYDGYFILSDLFRIPNLATEARSLVVRWLKSFYLGTPFQSERTRVTSGAWLGTYGVASGLYQFTIFILILYGFYRFFFELRLPTAGAALVVLVVGFQIARWWKGWRSWQLSSFERRYLQPGRLLVKIFVSLFVVLVLLLLPWPRSISVPYTVEAIDTRTIHAMVDGDLVDSIEEGSLVQRGDWLATLSNSRLEREISLLVAEEATLQSQLDQVMNRRSSNAEVASQIPAIRKAMESVRQQLDLRDQERARLTLFSPMDGVVLAPRGTNTPADSLSHRRLHWSGTPLDQSNRGTYLAAGSEICSVGSNEGRQIAMLVSQQDIELVRPGQKVQAYFPSRVTSYLTGTIEAIEMSPVEDLTSEWIASKRVPIETLGIRSGKTLEPVYRVVTRWKNEQVASLPVRSIGTARIHLDWCSIAERIRRFIFGVSVE